MRGGLLRSAFEETAEGLYLTSGYVYGSAAEAEKAFTGEVDRFVYSRYGNPTIEMFQERLRLIEGAEAVFATASGMSAVFTALGALLASGDRLVAARSLFGSCFVVCNEILPRWAWRPSSSTATTSRSGSRRCRFRPRRCSSRRHRIRCSRWWTSPQCRKWHMPPVRKWFWTTFCHATAPAGFPAGG